MQGRVNVGIGKLNITKVSTGLPHAELLGDSLGKADEHGRGGETSAPGLGAQAAVVGNAKGGKSGERARHHERTSDGTN